MCWVWIQPQTVGIHVAMQQRAVHKFTVYVFLSYRIQYIRNQLSAILKWMFFTIYFAGFHWHTKYTLTMATSSGKNLSLQLQPWESVNVYSKHWKCQSHWSCISVNFQKWNPKAIQVSRKMSQEHILAEIATNCRKHHCKNENSFTGRLKS